MGALFLAFFSLVLQATLLAWIIGFLRQIALVQIYGDPPFIPTPRETLATIAANLDIKPGDNVYELGSGDGRFLIYSAKREPSARYVGIEKNPVLILLSRIKALLAGVSDRVSFRRESFFDTDYSQATKIYAFLLNNTMDQLYPHLKDRFHGRLASRAFIFKEKNTTRTVSLSDKKGAYGEHLLHVYDF